MSTTTPTAAAPAPTYGYIVNELGIENLCDDDCDCASITIGRLGAEGELEAEFHISWIKILGAVAPRLTAFDDAWKAFTDIPDLFSYMAASSNTETSIETFIRALDVMGIKPVSR